LTVTLKFEIKKNYSMIMGLKDITIKNN